jgi:phage terminase large subunit GpA-like protein
MNKLFNEESKSIVCKNPSWMEPGYKKLTYEFTFTKAERKVFRKHKPIKVSEWAEKNRVLTMSAIPGSWRNSVTPYLVGIMDAMDYTSVREGSICKVPQSGVSEGCHNFVGKRIDRDPGPVLYVYPDQMTAKENSQDRVLPMIRSSLKLREYLTGYQDDESSFRINLQHMPIYFGWGSSAARLANKPIMIGVADEIDKPGFDVKKDDKETSPLKLIEKRFTTFRNSYKFWKISTPTVETGNIWIALKESEVIFDYWVKCPECSTFQIMIFDQIKWPGGKKADPDEIERKHLAHYECNFCSGEWNDSKRDLAVKGGEWRSRTERPLEIFKYLESFNPKKIGFHLPAWVPRFIPLSESASAFLKGLKDFDAMKDFINAYKAEAYIPRVKDRSEKSIKRLRDPERLSPIVPGGGVVAGLVAGVDTQDNGFWYEIRAIGWGLDMETWGIRSGYLETFEALEQVLWNNRYFDVDGNEYIVGLTVQDAMGHRTSEVYDFCRLNRGRILPFQGKQRLNQPFTYSNIEFYPGTKRAIPGGLRLLKADVNYYKNVLSRLLSVLPGDPGQYHYQEDITDSWIKQMTVEYINENGLWECPKNKDNHGWDCSVYGLVAADIAGIKYMNKPEENKIDLKNDNEEKTQTNTRKRPAWWNRRN